MQKQNAISCNPFGVLLTKYSGTKTFSIFIQNLLSNQAFRYAVFMQLWVNPKN